MLFPDISVQVSKLRMETSRLGRKQCNYNLSEKYFLDEVAYCLSVERENVDFISGALAKLRVSNGQVDQLKLLELEREGNKLLHSQSQLKEAMEGMTASAVLHTQMNLNTMDMYPTGSTQSRLTDQLTARTLLTLAQWLQQDHKGLAVMASQLRMIGQGDQASHTETVNNMRVLMEIEKSGVSQGKGVVLEDNTYGRNNA